MTETPKSMNKMTIFYFSNNKMNSVNTNFQNFISFDINNYRLFSSVTFVSFSLFLPMFTPLAMFGRKWDLPFKKKKQTNKQTGAL